MIWLTSPRCGAGLRIRATRSIPRCFVQAELDEIGDGADRIERLAGRFAAKEAVLKALGAGFGAGVAFTDVVIHRAPGAAPEVQLAGGAAKSAAAALGVTAWRLSISHAGGLAMASASRWGGGSRARLLISRTGQGR